MKRTESIVLNLLILFFVSCSRDDSSSSQVVDFSIVGEYSLLKSISIATDNNVILSSDETDYSLNKERSYIIFGEDNNFEAEIVYGLENSKELQTIKTYGTYNVKEGEIVMINRNESDGKDEVFSGTCQIDGNILTLAFTDNVNQDNAVFSIRNTTTMVKN